MSPDPTNGSSAARPCADGYGPHAQAHPAIHRFAAEVETILATTPADALPERVAEALAPVLATEDLLCDELRAPGAETYRKHVLFACPEGRFTFVCIVWQPGQGTDIHGHTAWGAVGVYQGTPNVACYSCEESAEGRHTATETKDIRCRPGDVATVRPGLCDTHRIYNDSDDVVITLHAYGRDLVENPDAINIHLSLAQ